jgi:hypothetical protein
MCSKDKTASLHLPLHILLTLAFCTCSLAVHFAAEGLAPVTKGQGYDLAAQGVQALQVDEHSEDNFILSSQTSLPVEHPATTLLSLVATRTPSFLISPPLPPPNS